MATITHELAGRSVTIIRMDGEERQGTIENANLHGEGVRFILVRRPNSDYRRYNYGTRPTNIRNAIIA